jgi:asparagine synthetase B (glutamine-hydrolysing)
LACFDGQSLEVSGESAFGRLTVAETPAWKVLFDGILHNARDLSDALPYEGPHQDTAAAIAGRGFELWGTGLFERMEGAFSILIWDKQGGRLLAARDPIGTWPLFYAQSGETWYCSTSVAVLRQCKTIHSSLNRGMLACWIAMVWPIHDETPFEPIRRVPSPRFLQMASNRSTLTTYWRPGRESLSGGDLEEHIEAFSGLFRRTIEHQLVLGKAGVFLSGGIDSVSVAAHAADIAALKQDPLPLALSVRYTAPGEDESPVQTSVARRLGLEHIIRPIDQLVGPDGLVAEAMAISRSAAVFISNPWQPLYLRLAGEGKRNGLVTILSGAGGDEWLGVSPSYASDLIRSGDVGRLVHLFRSYRRSFNLPLWSSTRNVLWSYGLRPVLGEIGGNALARVARDRLLRRKARHWKRKWPAWLAPDPALRHDLDERIDRLVEEELRRSKEEPRRYWREVEDGLEHIVVAMEREERFEEARRLGLMLLAPYEDAGVVKFLYLTMPEVLNAGGRAKSIARTDLERRFPALGFGSQKKSFSRGTSRKKLFPTLDIEWERTGGVRCLGELGIIDTKLLAVAIREEGGLLPSTYLSWQMLYTCYVEHWLRGQEAL